MFYHQSAQTFAKTQFSLQAMPNKQYWNTSPRYYHHHPTPGPGKSSDIYKHCNRTAGYLRKVLHAWCLTNFHVIKRPCLAPQILPSQNYQRLHTVDGWNPAPVEVGSLSMFIPLFIGFHTSQVVIAGFHPSTVTQGLCCALKKRPYQALASSSTKGMVKYTPSSWHWLPTVDGRILISHTTCYV